MGSFVHVRIIAYFDFDVNPKLKQNVNKISQQVFSMVKKLRINIWLQETFVYLFIGIL